MSKWDDFDLNKIMTCQDMTSTGPEVPQPLKNITLPIIKDVELKPLFEDMTDEDWKKSVEDSTRMSQDVINLMREVIPAKIAEDIMQATAAEDAMREKVSKEMGVKLMSPGDCVKAMFDMARPEAELIAEGYEPVCPHTRLMWVKKTNSVEEKDLSRADDDGFVKR